MLVYITIIPNIVRKHIITTTTKYTSQAKKIDNGTWKNYRSLNIYS